jgi:hypothetical protein
MTLQFANGGLFDAEPVGPIHLIRSTKHGTPGPTLCGIDRFANGAPGWSVGGGVTGPDVHPVACEGCQEARDDLPVGGLFRSLFPTPIGSSEAEGTIGDGLSQSEAAAKPPSATTDHIGPKSSPDHIHRFEGGAET